MKIHGKKTNERRQARKSNTSHRQFARARVRLDAKLDEALMETFPASDPFNVTPERNLDGVSTYASPPCFMHELDPSYLGYLGQTEVLDLLNLLLEGERAGAKGASAMKMQTIDVEARQALLQIAKDEARFCTMLTGHIVRMGGKPSLQTGAFYRKLRSLETAREQIALLERGQGWVVRKIRETLPKIGDDALHGDLTEMLTTHQRNIERVSALNT